MLSARSPQLWFQPAVTALKLPAGASASPQLPGVTFEAWPQQVMVLSARSPQLWFQPAVTALKLPAGASACPASLLPQQVMVLSARSPQLWFPPAVTALNVPAPVSVSVSRRVPSLMALSSTIMSLRVKSSDWSAPRISS